MLTVICMACGKQKFNPSPPALGWGTWKLAFPHFTAQDILGSRAVFRCFGTAPLVGFHFPIHIMIALEETYQCVLIVLLGKHKFITHLDITII